MMTRKQKLRNAVVLGLLLSSVTAGSACAWEPVQAPGWTANRNSNSAERIENHLDYNGQKGELEFGIWAHSNKVVFDYIGVANVNADSLIIDVYNNFFANNKDGNWAVGILAGEKTYDVADGNLSSWVNVNTKNGLVVNVKTRNAEDGYGIFANKLGNININNSIGDVYVNVQKSLGYGTPGIGDGNVNYDKSNVYAIKAISDGNIKINSENGNIVVDAFYNKDDAEKNNKLKQGNIYGVSNINGTVGLTAGEGIHISANSADGDAYGIYANSDKETVLNGKVNIIEAVADGTGKAVGITAENGSKVNITGDTAVSGDDGALVIKGNSSGTTTLADGQYQVTVDGNLHASAQDGAAIHVTKGGSMYVTKDAFFDTEASYAESAAGMIIDSSEEVKVDGSVIGSAENTNGILVKNNSALAVGENVQVSSGEKALIVEQGSTAGFNGDTGVNMLYGKNGALDAQGEVSFGSNAIFVADDTADVNVNVENTNLTVNGYVVVQGGKIGLNVVSDKIDGNDEAVLGRDGVTNYVFAQNTALNADNVGITMNGDSVFATSAQGSTAVNIINGAGFENSGDFTVHGGKYGINANNPGLILVSGDAVIEAADKDGIALNVVGNDKGSSAVIKGDAVIISNGSVGANIENSVVEIGGEAYIAGQETGLKIQQAKDSIGDYKYDVNLGKKDGINYITAANTAVDLNGKLTMNGKSYFYASGKNSAAVKVQAGSEFVNNGAVQVQGGQYGFQVTDSTANIKAENGVNFFIASGFREDVTDEATEGNFSNAVNVGSGASFSASGAGNVLQAGEVVNGYGNETAVSVREGEFSLKAGSVGNMIAGAIYAAGNTAVVDITAGSGGNYIFSSTHGRTGDSVHLVSAVYAADNSNINISAGEDGVNVIRSYAELHTDKDNGGHFDEEGNLLDREITVWAENGSKVNIDGAVFIAASNNGEYTLNEDGDPVKGNALGIAVSAGGRSLEYNTDGDVNSGLKPVENISNVNIDYASNIKESSIIGDIVAGYGGEVNIGQNLISVHDGHTVSMGGDSSLKIKGNILAGNGGVANVDFGKGGYWEGRADDYGDANIDGHTGFFNPAFSNKIEEGGTTSIKMYEGYWNVTGQSWLTNFTATDTIIDMVSYENNGTHALTIKNMEGSGNTFIMGLNHTAHESSDMLYIKEGNADINVVVSGTIEGLDTVSTDNALRFATVGAGIKLTNSDERGSYINGYDNGVFNTKLYVKASAYDTEDTQNNNSYNGDSVDADKPGSGSVEDFFDLDKQEEQKAADGIALLDEKAVNSNPDNLEIVAYESNGLSEAGQTVLSLSKVNYSNAIYMDRFNKRMGEARFIDGDEGVWVRLRHDRIGKTDAFRSQNTMYEIGYDVKQIKDNGEHRIGFAVDYMDGESEFTGVNGRGEVSRKGLWMYDSWMGEKGHYRDIIAKWGHLSNDFEFTTSLGNDVAADFSNNVYSISTEYGKKNAIGSNWYFEPQVQLQFAHVTDADYATSMNGTEQTQIHNDAFNSLIARAGFRLGRDISDHSTVYFKGDVMHEFLGDQDIYAKDTTADWENVGYENDGTWYDLGFGFATKVNKASYAYLDFEKSFGNDNDETYQINAGMQWTF